MPDNEWVRILKKLVGKKVEVTAGSSEKKRKGICRAIHFSGLAVAIEREKKKISVIRFRAVDEL